MLQFEGNIVFNFNWHIVFWEQLLPPTLKSRSYEVAIDLAPLCFLHFFWVFFLLLFFFLLPLFSFFFLPIFSKTNVVISSPYSSSFPLFKFLKK